MKRQSHDAPDGPRAYDQLRANKKLKKIGRADLADRLSHPRQWRVLVTRNEQHFRHGPGVRVENWAD